MMVLVLPFPPSVNGYWRAVGGRNILSARGRAYRDAALAVIAAQPHRRFPATAHLSVHITLHAPTQQKRDVDNYCKGALDALTHAGVFADDSQIDTLTVTRGAVRPRDGLLVIRIKIATPEMLDEDIDHLIATLPLPGRAAVSRQRRAGSAAAAKVVAA